MWLHLNLFDNQNLGLSLQQFQAGIRIRDLLSSALRMRYASLYQDHALG